VHAVWSPVRDYIGTRVIGVLSCFARAGVAGRRFVDEGGTPPASRGTTRAWAWGFGCWVGRGP
jgi:hypothetical protein